MRKYKGFTLIELLIVVAIIGILATIILVFLNSARLRAKDASFKSTVSSVRTNLVMCCDGGKTFADYTSPGGLICAGGNSYPDDTAVGIIRIDNDCNSGNGEFTLTITPGSKDTGNCTEAIITNEQTTFADC